MRPLNPPSPPPPTARRAFAKHGPPTGKIPTALIPVGRTRATSVAAHKDAAAYSDPDPNTSRPPAGKKIKGDKGESKAVPTSTPKCKSGQGSSGPRKYCRDSSIRSSDHLTMPLNLVEHWINPTVEAAIAAHPERAGEHSGTRPSVGQELKSQEEKLRVNAVACYICWKWQHTEGYEWPRTRSSAGQCA